jgi:MFS family permease
MPENGLANQAKQSHSFMFLYALAVAGGSVAYIPFLTILLPIRSIALAGDKALQMLAIAAFAGAIAASIANIGFGWISDITQNRRRWIFAGLIMSSALLFAMQFATSQAALIAMIVCWQIGLNMMLAPLTAWAGDCVPDTQKGMLGGLLAFAPALGAMAGVLVTLKAVAPAFDRQALLIFLIVIMVGPVLLFGRPVSMPHLMKSALDLDRTKDRADATSNAVARMWSARLLVQIAEASLFAFLLIWFRSIEPDFDENDAASIFTAILGIAVLFALVVGRWSDRTRRPILPLTGCAGLAAIGLLIMSVAPNLTVAIIGYVIFGLASSVFLALHSSQTLRILPRPQTRGRDLGLFNLTNTVPSLIMPWLTLALVPSYGFDALFLVLAVLAASASGLLFNLQRRA